MNRSHSLRVGDIAAAVGVSVDTIRYYEKLQLLPKVSRSPNGFRVFSADVIEHVRFVKQCQEIGFSLGEIRQLFASRNSQHECQTVHVLLLKKVLELESKLEQIKRFKTVLNQHLAECKKELETHGDACECPVLATIGKNA